MRHARQIHREIRVAQSMNSSELYGYAKQLGVPLDLLQKTAKLGRLPVVNFAAGGLGRWLENDCVIKFCTLSCPQYLVCVCVCVCVCVWWLKCPSTVTVGPT